MQAVSSFVATRKSLFFRAALLALPVLVLLVLLAPTVFAQTTYVITDGDQVTVYTTYATNPATVLDRAGFQLGAEDTYTTQAGDGVSEITVQRAHTVFVYDNGQEIKLNSYGETVQSLLERAQIVVKEGYTADIAMNTITCDGMQIHIDPVIKQEQCYTVEAPFKTIEVADPKLPLGVTKVLEEGVPGEKTVFAEVVYTNYKESQRNVLREMVVQAPVDQIVAVGTGEAVGNTDLPAIGNGIIVTADGDVLTYKRVEQFKTTAYSHLDPGCDMITATGTTVRIGSVAVDPKVIPYGTRMFIVSNDGKYVYGIATAEDCGGAIKGYEIDLYMPTREICFKYGVRRATVYFLD